jgi:hypothetical protein
MNGKTPQYLVISGFPGFPDFGGFLSPPWNCCWGEPDSIDELCKEVFVGASDTTTSSEEKSEIH